MQHAEELKLHKISIAEYAKVRRIDKSVWESVAINWQA